LQEKKAPEIQYLGCHLIEFDDDMNEKNQLDLSSDGKKLAVEDAESLIPVKDKRQLHSSEPWVQSKKSSGTKVDVKQSSEECRKVMDSLLFDMKKLKLFGDTLCKQCSGKSASQGEYYDWNIMGHDIGICFWALPSHCTFAAGWWDSHVTVSQLHQLDVNPSLDQQCGSSDCILELDGHSVKDHPPSNSPHED